MEFISLCLKDGNAGRVNNSYGSTEFPGISQNGVIGDQIELELRPVISEDGVTIYSPEVCHIILKQWRMIVFCLIEGYTTPERRDRCEM